MLEFSDVKPEVLRVKGNPIGLNAEQVTIDWFGVAV